MRNQVKLVLTMIMMLAVWSCQSDTIHKDMVDIKNQEWLIADIKTFEFEINDVSKPLNVSYLVRNAINYPYYNLYLKCTLKDSSGKVLEGGMEELILFDEQSGKPKGDGMGDLFDHKIGAAQFKNVTFPKAGKYSFEIQHNMRPDPLTGIMSIGLEIKDPSQKE